MGTPQIIMIVLLTVGLTVNLVKHGEPLDVDEYHFGIKLFRVMLLVGLLWWGGFWN